MAKSSTRRVSIYINSEEVEATVKQIHFEMNKLVNEQNRMIIGCSPFLSCRRFAACTPFLRGTRLPRREDTYGRTFPPSFRPCRDAGRAAAAFLPSFCPCRGIYVCVGHNSYRYATPNGVVVGLTRSLATDMDPLTGMFCELPPKSWGKNQPRRGEIPPLLSSLAECGSVERNPHNPKSNRKS